MSYYGRNKIDIIFSQSSGIDLSAITAEQSDVLASKKFMDSTGALKDGSMPNNGAQASEISTKAQEVTIAAGYHNGSGKVKISDAEQAKIIGTNIRAGITILGVEGNISPDKPAQSKSVTPTTSQQIVSADTGYELEQVTVGAVDSDIDDNIIAENIKSGVTILGVTGTLSNPVEVSTAEALAALDIPANEGKVFKYTGTNGTYTNGAYYIIS